MNGELILHKSWTSPDGEVVFRNADGYEIGRILPTDECWDPDESETGKGIVAFVPSVRPGGWWDATAFTPLIPDKSAGIGRIGQKMISRRLPSLLNPMPEMNKNEIEQVWGTLPTKKLALLWVHATLKSNAPKAVWTKQDGAWVLADCHYRDLHPWASIRKIGKEEKGWQSHVISGDHNFSSRPQLGRHSEAGQHHMTIKEAIARVESQYPPDDFDILGKPEEADK